MAKLSEIATDKRFLITGASGSGKTNLIGTLACLVPTVIAYHDKNGIKDTLESMPILPETEFVFIEDWHNIWECYDQIKQLSNNHLALAMDDFGAIQDVAKDKIELEPRSKYEDAAMNKDRNEFRRNISEQIMLGERALQLQQYGSLYISVNELLVNVLALSYPIKTITCLERKEKNPRTNEDHLYPAIVGQIGDNLAAKFSMVIETFTTSIDNKTAFCATCKAHPRLETKWRGHDGFTMINPSFEKILARMNGKEVETKQEEKIGFGF
jgi:energy-coupling factor transporter ATP-binding protein EcfA2